MDLKNNLEYKNTQYKNTKRIGPNPVTGWLWLLYTEWIIQYNNNINTVEKITSPSSSSDQLVTDDLLLVLDGLPNTVTRLPS